MPAGVVPDPALLAGLFGVAGRAALVTGGGTGIGLAIAEVLARAGAEVTVAGIDAEPLAAAAAALRGQGLAVRDAVVDVADRPAVRALVQDVAGRAGRLDIVVANAGISAGPGPTVPGRAIEAGDDAAWDRVIAVNLTGAFATIQAAAPALRRSDAGRVLVTASTAALRGHPRVGYAYAASKAALVGLVRQAAIDFASDGVVVNAIAPGPIRTEFGGGRLGDPAVGARFAAESVLGRLGHPAELRGLALLLCSPSASYITGAVIPVDGGVTAASPA